MLASTDGAGLGISSKQSTAANWASENPAPGPPPASAARASSSQGVRVGSQLQVYTWGGLLVSGEAGLERMVRRHRWACPCQPGGRQIGSVVLEERKQVIVAVRGEVGWAQVGQQPLGLNGSGSSWGQKKPDSSSGLRPATSSQSGPQAQPGSGCPPHQPPTQASTRAPQPAPQGLFLPKTCQQLESLVLSCPRTTWDTLPVRGPEHEQMNAEGVEFSALSCAFHTFSR